VVLDHAPSPGVSIVEHGTAKFLRVGLAGGAHRRIKILWGRCQSNAGRYQDNEIKQWGQRRSRQRHFLSPFAARRLQHSRRQCIVIAASR
jgi:hypothetical protein